MGLAIFQLPDANALETADLVKAKMDELSVDFPEGVIYEAGYDTTPFIRESIREVFKSLRDAVILVALVVLVFLQGWRPAIIPLIAVPVAIVGTFAAMVAVGFSLNNLTLFGLVLAIGIVVDDAIVVVEAVEQYIERGFSPRDAAIHAMDEVAGPVIAVGLVLTAVFVPCAFVSGIVGSVLSSVCVDDCDFDGDLHHQLTDAQSRAGGVVAAATTCKEGHAHAVAGSVVRLVFSSVQFLRFEIDRRLHLCDIPKLLRVPLLVLLVYGGLLGLTWFGFNALADRALFRLRTKGILSAACSCRTQHPLSER